MPGTGSIITFVAAMSIRPIPYTTSLSTTSDKLGAAWLRSKIVPQVKRRIKGHHLCGFRNDYIVSTVAEKKQEYPWFIRTDIRQFYPNIRHRDIHPNIVVGYRKLLSHSRIPINFEMESRRICGSFLRSLDIPKGLPLGNAMSVILAPAMLIPLWLDIRTMFQVPMIVFMDDILLFAKNERQANEIWLFLINRLAEDYGLEPNLTKTVSGRFAGKSVDFAGWHFAGGYARITDDKMNAFMERFTERIKQNRGKSYGALRKSINRGIDGFGHHYKHGNTGKQFEILDKFIRLRIREELRRRGIGADTTNEGLKREGFRSLSDIYRKTHPPEVVKGRKLRRFGHDHAPTAIVKASTKDKSPAELILAVERLEKKMDTIVALMGKQLKALNSLCAAEEDFRHL